MQNSRSLKEAFDFVEDLFTMTFIHHHTVVQVEMFVISVLLG